MAYDWDLFGKILYCYSTPKEEENFTKSIILFLFRHYTLIFCYVLYVIWEPRPLKCEQFETFWCELITNLTSQWREKKRVDEKLSITWYLTIIPNETISYNCFSGCKSITSTYLWFSSIDLFQNVDKLL